MRKHLSPLTILLLSAGTIFAQNLPSDSQLLIDRLSDYSSERRAKAEAEIAEKSKQVSKVLESHLKRETQAGKLGAALAIKSKIEELSKAFQRPSKITSVSETKDVKDDDLILGSWSGVSSSGWKGTFEFFSNGIVKTYTRDKPTRESTWKIKQGKELSITHPQGGTDILTLPPKSNVVVGETAAGNELTLTKIEASKSE